MRSKINNVRMDEPLHGTTKNNDHIQSVSSLDESEYVVKTIFLYDWFLTSLGIKKISLRYNILGLSLYHFSE